MNNLIDNFLQHNIFITFILLLIYIIVIFVLVLLLLIFLDLVFTLNIKANFLLDHIIPLMMLFVPYILVFFVQPFNSWFTHLFFLILFHILFLIPFFYHWSYLREWDKNENITFLSWTHPRIYKNIVFALIYPLVWGLYLSCVRFFRLGSTIYVVDFFYNLEPDLIIFLFLSPYLFFWLLIPLNNFINMRKFLWDQLAVLIYSAHLFLLNTPFYFRCMESLFKCCFLVHVFFSINLNFNKKYKDHTIFYKLLSYIYGHPQLFVLLLFIFLVTEIIITSVLYYGLYLLFVFPLLYGIFSCFFAFGFTDFIFDCCLSDYIRRNWGNPYYPNHFWLYFRDAEYYYGFFHGFNKHETRVIHKKLKTSFWHLRKKVSLDMHRQQLFQRVKKRLPVKFMWRVALWYMEIHGEKWNSKKYNVSN